MQAPLRRGLHLRESCAANFRGSFRVIPEHWPQARDGELADSGEIVSVRSNRPDLDDLQPRSACQEDET